MMFSIVLLLIVVGGGATTHCHARLVAMVQIFKFLSDDQPTARSRSISHCRQLARSTGIRRLRKYCQIKSLT